MARTQSTTSVVQARICSNTELVMQQRPIQQHTTVLVVVLQGDIVNAHGLV